MTKIVKTEVEGTGDHKIVKITLEKDGKEYGFSAKATDVMNEKTFKSLLKYWNEKAIPEKEADAGISEEALSSRLKKIAGKILK